MFKKLTIQKGVATSDSITSKVGKNSTTSKLAFHQNPYRWNTSSDLGIR
jgi:hypothetical protein